MDQWVSTHTNEGQFNSSKQIRNPGEDSGGSGWWKRRTLSRTRKIRCFDYFTFVQNFHWQLHRAGKLTAWITASSRDILLFESRSSRNSACMRVGERARNGHQGNVQIGRNLHRNVSAVLYLFAERTFVALSFSERKTEFLIRNVIIWISFLNFIFRFNRYLFSFVIYTCL